MHIPNQDRWDIAKSDPMVKQGLEEVWYVWTMEWYDPLLRHRKKLNHRSSFSCLIHILWQAWFDFWFGRWDQLAWTNVRGQEFEGEVDTRWPQTMIVDDNNKILFLFSRLRIQVFTSNCNFLDSTFLIQNQSLIWRCDNRKRERKEMNGAIKKGKWRAVQTVVKLFIDWMIRTKIIITTIFSVSSFSYSYSSSHFWYFNFFLVNNKLWSEQFVNQGIKLTVCGRWFEWQLILRMDHLPKDGNARLDAWNLCFTHWARFCIFKRVNDTIFTENVATLCDLQLSIRIRAYL